jgi:hypothetical protein
MSKQIQIEVPKPCHENWDAMSPEQQGKFCGVCSKTVVDFSLMSDGQILETIQKNTGSMCGRFSNDQLERPLIKPLQPKWYMAGMWKYVLSSFMLFKVANVKAQQKPEIVNCPKPADSKTHIKMGQLIAPVVNTLKAMVQDEYGIPVVGASIIVTGTNKGTQTDKYGQFEIKVQKKQTIEISHVGYITMTATINEKGSNVFTLKSFNLPTRTMGIVVYVSPEKIEAHKQEVIYTIKDSASGLVIPYATIMVEYNDKKKAMAANATGNVKVKLEKGVKEIKVSVSAIGYNTINQVPYTTLNNQQEILLSPKVTKQEDVEVIGFTVGKLIRTTTVCGTTAVKGEVLATVKDTVSSKIPTRETMNFTTKNDDLIIFPNPAKRSEPLQLQYTAATAETIMFQLSTIEGKIISLQKEKAQNGINTYQLQIPSNIAAQVLVIKLMNSSGKWISTQQCIVE